MESVKDYSKTNLSENSSISKDVTERAVESSESFLTASACYNTEKPESTETENLKGNRSPCGVQGDLEQYSIAPSQLEIPDTLGSQSKKMFQGHETDRTEQDKCISKDGHRCKGPHGVVRGPTFDSHKTKQPQTSRKYIEQRNSHAHQADVPESPSQKNRSCEYFGRQNDPVTCLGQTYKSEHQDQFDPSLPMVDTKKHFRHKVGTGSATHSHSSRSPTSLRSPNSSKSNMPMQLDSNATTYTGANRSPLPPGFGKSSTPNKSQPGSSSQGQSNRTTLPAGTTASSSQTCTPNKHPSHNTSIQSENIVCRICHDGDASEVLISPCYCAGSMGLLHVSCLQRWLGSSNKTSCEICNFEFSLRKKTMPISQFLKEPGSAQDKRNLLCDLVCFLLITPLTVVVIWICIHGAAKYYPDSQAEKSGLIGLAVSLILLYAAWITFATRHYLRIWKDWKMFHQEVTLLCTPSQNKKPENSTPRSVESRSTLGSIQLQSITVSVHGPMTRYKYGNRNERRRQKGEVKQRATSNVSDSSDQKPDRQYQNQNTIGSRHAIPSISESIGENTDGQDGKLQLVQDPWKTWRWQSKDGQIDKEHIKKENMYYNTGVSKEVDERADTVGKMPASLKNGCKHGNITSCNSSSVCSSNLSDAHIQRSRKLRPDINKPDKFSQDGHSGITNATNLSPIYRSGGPAESINPYTGAKLMPQGHGNVAQSQQRARLDKQVPCNSLALPEEYRSQEDQQEFIHKWVNDQTMVLVRQTKQRKDQVSLDTQEVRSRATESVPGNNVCGRDISRGVRRHDDLVKQAENFKNRTVVREPATLSQSSSDTSFEQIMKENNLAPSSHVSENERHFAHHMD